MKEKNCVICKSTHFKKIFDVKRPDFKQPLEIVQCQNCRLIFQPADLNQETAAKYYNCNYYRHQDNWLEKILINFLDNIRVREINKYGAKGKVLDIGCGNGKLLLKLKQQDWEVVGLDTSPAAYKEARKSLGGLVFNKELKECNFPSNYFDVVVLWHVLEHVFSPNELLTEIYRILKPRGALVVEVPNIASPVYYLTKQGYFSFDDPTHLYHFSPKTLHQLLKNNHFQLKAKGCVVLSLIMSLFTGLANRIYYQYNVHSWSIIKLILLIFSPLLILLTLFFRFLSIFFPIGETLRFYYIKI